MKAYANSLKQFARTNKKEFRMLPINGGAFAGPYQSKMHLMTPRALAMGYDQLSNEEKLIIKGRSNGISMHIFVEDEYEKFDKAFREVNKENEKQTVVGKTSQMEYEQRRSDPETIPDERRGKYRDTQSHEKSTWNREAASSSREQWASPQSTATEDQERGRPRTMTWRQVTIADGDENPSNRQHEGQSYVATNSRQAGGCWNCLEPNCIARTCKNPPRCTICKNRYTGGGWLHSVQQHDDKAQCRKCGRWGHNIEICPNIDGNWTWWRDSR